MYRIITYSFIFIIIAVSIISLSSERLFVSVCEQPIAYRIGNIDPEFNISSTTARGILQKAESVWERPIDRELFEYKAEADFVVNFLYDHRQQTSNTVNTYEETLNDLEASHSEVITAYEAASNEYNSRLISYENQLDQYDNKLRAYNDKVTRWNERGGAPEDVREKLIEEQEFLRKELQSLDSQQDDLEVLRRQVNELADRGNMVAEEYNQTATTFSERFGTSHEFSQATYTGDAINVYQFEGEQDLMLALVHEFGHALGIEHVSSTDSVMHYLMQDQLLENISLSNEDLKALRNVCEIND